MDVHRRRGLTWWRGTYGGTLKMSNIWGWGDYFRSQNPEITGPTSDTGTTDRKKGEIKTGENKTGNGQPGSNFNKAGGDAEPPSLLKPIIYAAAVGAALTLLT